MSPRNIVIIYDAPQGGLRFDGFDYRHMGALLAILVLLLVGWFWLDSLRAREIASGISRQACARAGLQFLDGTVALTRLGLERDDAGHLRIRRQYHFEYTSTGELRDRGVIVMRGAELARLVIGQDILA